MAPVNRSLFLTPKEYAAILGVHVDSVWRWIKEHREGREGLETVQPSGPRGRHFIRRELLESHGKPRS